MKRRIGKRRTKIGRARGKLFHPSFSGGRATEKEKKSSGNRSGVCSTEG